MSGYPFFVDPSENPVAELGSGFLQNYLGNGALSKGFAVVTQRRVYFNGRSYFKDFKGRWRKQMQAKTVDLKDVTGTGYISVRMLGLLISAIATFFWPLLTLPSTLHNRSLIEWLRAVYFNSYDLWSLALWLPTIGLVIAFFTHRRTLFNIEFAGGNISFRTSWYGKSEVDDFQKALRKAMAVIKDQEPVTTPAAVTVHTMSAAPTTSAGAAKDKAEALREIAKLKDDGIISEDEFQQMKADLMNEGK